MRPRTIILVSAGVLRQVLARVSLAKINLRVASK
jgi:hypothetical protein